MIPWSLIDSAPIPGGGAVRLMRRGEEYSIKLGDNELMNSRLGGSEEQLAAISCAKLRGRRRIRLLIGGLGMGFTLRAALSALDGDAHIIVAELVPAIVAWAQGALAHVFGESMQDPRVSLHVGNVADLIGGARSTYDAILLDVDNGPDGLSSRTNDRLYSTVGLRAAHAALRAGGVFAVWSAQSDAAFSKRLNVAGFSAEEIRLRANGRRGGSRHVVWIAVKRDDRSA